MIRSFVLFNIVLFISYILATKAEQRDNPKWLLAFLILLLSAFSGCRSVNVGMDTHMYVYFYSLGGNHPAIEVGFQKLFEFLHNLNNDYTLGLFTVSFITCALIIIRFWTLRRFAPLKYSVVAFFCMFYYMTMSGMRQWLAISIVFFGTYFLYEKKSVPKYLISLGIAFLFHKSTLIGLVFLIPWFISKSTKTWEKLIKLLFFLGLPISVFYVINTFSTEYGDLLGSTKSSLGFMVFARLLALLLMIITGVNKDTSQKSNDFQILTENKLYFIQIVALSLTFLDYFFRDIARIGWYFEIFTPIIYGIWLKKITTRETIYLKSLICLVIFYLYINMLIDPANRIVPYQFYWEV